MSEIIEKVARATHHAECEPHKAETGYGDIFGWDDVMPQVQTRHRAIARAAIKATIEYLRDNVTNRMLSAAESADTDTLSDVTWRECFAIEFRGALSQAISDLDHPSPSNTGDAT